MIPNPPIKKKTCATAHFVRQPAHNRRENPAAKYCAELKMATAVPSPAPGTVLQQCDCCPGKKAIPPDQPETKRKEGDNNAETTKDIDKTPATG